jgi:PadR family transcriptional regulator, regulatory protein PadR
MTAEKKQGNFGGPPKNFLVPFILLLLGRTPDHGYELIHKLASMGFSALDQGNFYRIMRQLEKDNYVHSQWDTSTGGPAKRLYSLTEFGENYLQAYADELQRYQGMLGQFFNMYSKMFDLCLFPFRKEGDGSEKHIHPKRRASDEPEGND